MMCHNNMQNYFYEQIYVRSTDMDRTLISTNSNLAGLYAQSTDDEDEEGPIRNPLVPRASSRSN